MGEHQKKYRRTKYGLLNCIYNDQKSHSKRDGRPAPEYTMEEFRSYYVDNPVFVKHYSRWVENGYIQFFRPCFDRVDCFLPYTFDNIRVISCRGNQQKAVKERKEHDDLKRQRHMKYYEESHCKDCENDRIKKIEVYEEFTARTCTICGGVEVQKNKTGGR